MMADDKNKSSGTLTLDDLDTSGVMEDAEEWSVVETKLVVGSLIAAAVALIIGLWLVPTSILH